MICKNIRLIKTDRTGHSVSVINAAEFANTQFGRSEVVTINGQQVNTVEDFLRAVETSQDSEPEVLVFPPLAGG